MATAIGPVLAAFGVGLALAGSPGPVQAILLVESVRGGTGRGFRAQAGANSTLAILLLALALGLATLTPGPTLIRVLKVAGGAFLIWLAVEGYLSRRETLKDASGHRRLPPPLRGSAAVILNPGTYLFLATVASAVLSSASKQAGVGAALLAALALVVGVAIGDGAVVLFGGLGVRRAGARVILVVRTVLAGLLAVLGVVLVLTGIV